MMDNRMTNDDIVGRLRRIDNDWGTNDLYWEAADTITFLRTKLLEKDEKTGRLAQEITRLRTALAAYEGEDRG